jgi:NHLM bacteriocin system ABC transporter peptidase/ATP-binding protein
LASSPPLTAARRVRTPTVLQMEAVECGAAALAIVLAYHGLIVSLEELRLACGVSRNGSNASNLLRAARRYGMEARGFKKELSQIPEVPLPAVVFWNFNHFLVLEGYDQDRYFLNDPASGPTVVSAQEFDESFTGVVLTFRPTAEFRKGGTRPSLIGALRRRLRGSRDAVAFAVVAGAALVVPGLVIPTFARLFVDQVLVAHSEGWFRPLLVGLALTAALRVALAGLQRRVLLRLETKISVATAGGFLWHVLRLPVEFYTQRYAGDIAGRVALNARVATFLAARLASAAIDALLVVFFPLLMLSYDAGLTAIALGTVVLVGAATALVNRMRVDGYRRVLQEQGKAGGTITAGLAIIEGLKATGTESDLFARWAGYHAKVMNAQQELNRVTQLFLTAPTFVVAIANAAVLALGGYRVAQGEMTMGMLVAFQALMASFFLPVTNLVGLAAELQAMEGNMNRIDDVLKSALDPELVREPPAEGDGPQPRLAGQLEFRDVSFGYSRLDSPLIQGLSFKLAPGSRVAIVGPSGCGKSTVARLITGQYQPWEGAVLFDGRPRAAHTRTVLANSVAVVDQDIALFEGSVRDNLTLWDATVPESVLVKACQDAGLHDEIVSRRGGYDSRVEEGGVNFSGGQRQRLEIARALVTEPRVLVLDEATSAVDPLTEVLIDRNLRRRGCTCVVIAHRLSTIRDADEILVLRQGQVSQRGSHETLAADLAGDYALLTAEA